LNIHASELTFVIGRIGSGKTALLNAIMNEMDNIFAGKEGE
jgi:ABC-type branched-subunit amino acid transport system ATPase component